MNSAETVDLATLLGSGSRGQTNVTPSRKVVVLNLCSQRQFSTHGATTWHYYPVGPRALSQVGPSLQDVTIHGGGKDLTANFQWKLVGEKSLEGEGWASFSNDLLPAQTANGATIGNAYSTASDFGLLIRFLVGIANVSGTAIEVGNITAYAALKFWT